VRSLTFARPVIDVGALAIRNFSRGWLVSFVIGIGIFATFYLRPRFLRRVRLQRADQHGDAVRRCDSTGSGPGLQRARQSRWSAVADDVRPRLLPDGLGPLRIVQPDALSGRRHRIASCGTILNDRTNLHFLRIAEHNAVASLCATPSLPP